MATTHSHNIRSIFHAIRLTPQEDKKEKTYDSFVSVVEAIPTTLDGGNSMIIAIIIFALIVYSCCVVSGRENDAEERERRNDRT